MTDRVTSQESGGWLSKVITDAMGTERQRRLRPRMIVGRMIIGGKAMNVTAPQTWGSPQIDSASRIIGVRSRVRPNSITSQMTEAITGMIGSPQMFEGQLNIGAIADRTAAGLLMISLRGITGGILHRKMLADGRQEETAAGGRRRRRRRSSSSAAPKAPLPRGSPRSRSVGGSKGEGMMGSP